MSSSRNLLLDLPLEVFAKILSDRFGGYVFVDLPYHRSSGDNYKILPSERPPIETEQMLTCSSFYTNASKVLWSNKFLFTSTEQQQIFQNYLAEIRDKHDKNNINLFRGINRVGYITPVSRNMARSLELVLEAAKEFTALKTMDIHFVEHYSLAWEKSQSGCMEFAAEIASYMDKEWKQKGRCIACVTIRVSGLPESPARGVIFQALGMALRPQKPAILLRDGFRADPVARILSHDIDLVD